MPLAASWASWELALRARDRSEGTIKSYKDTVLLFAAWLAENELPDDVQAIDQTHVRAWLVHERERTTPGNAHKHFRNLRALFNWLIEEGERTAASPVRSADQPHVPETERPVLSSDNVLALLDTCKGASFRQRRDAAIIRVLYDSGPRVSGLVGIRYTPTNADTNDLSLTQYRVRIRLKGGDTYLAPIGRQSAQALDRYLRVRAVHDHADLPWLWLGERGRLSVSGVEQMIKRRGKMIGIDDLTPHWFRRASATAFLDAGGGEIDAMHVYGWKSTAMVQRYTKETARERARDAHARLSPGDRL